MRISNSVVFPDCGRPRIPTRFTVAPPGTNTEPPAGPCTSRACGNVEPRQSRRRAATLSIDGRLPSGAAVLAGERGLEAGAHAHRQLDLVLGLVQQDGLRRR